MSDLPGDFAPDYGRPVTVVPGVRRVTANNPGPYTGAGTNTYLVGYDSVAVIDPGPDDPAHVAAVLAALDGEDVSCILLTHAHRDHSGAVAALAAATDAPTMAALPRPAGLADGRASALDAPPDPAFTPEAVLRDGTVVKGDGWRLEAVATPGHASDHMHFLLDGAGLAFSGDHVMAWSTTVVAPPDGSMADYMASLDRLIARPETRFLPGHGAPVEDAHARLRGLKTHRRMREAAILERLAKGDRTIAEIVAAIYRDTDPRLHGAASQSVLAHMEDLVARGLVAPGGAVAIDGRYRPA